MVTFCCLPSTVVHIQEIGCERIAKYLFVHATNGGLLR